MSLKAHGSHERVPTHGQLLLNSSDLPATRKLIGLRSHSSQYFMCPWCSQTVTSLTHEDCFPSESRLSSVLFALIYLTASFHFTEFHLRDDWRYLKYAFMSQRAGPELREQIADKKGVRWSSLNSLPGWLPAQCSPLEFMHATFLGKLRLK